MMTMSTSCRNSLRQLADFFLSSRRRRRARTEENLFATPAILEARQFLSATANNTFRDGVANLNNDVYSFDPTGGTNSNPSAPPPKNSFYINAVIASTLPSGWVVDRYVTGDFSGDRQLDVAVQVGTSWYIGTRVGSTFTFNTSVASGTTPGAGNSNFIVGNFHGTAYSASAGTGKEDIAYRDSVGTWQILPSNQSWGLPAASGFAAVVNSGATWSKTSGGPYDQFQKLDVDNNGLDDIVSISGAGTQQSTAAQIWVVRSTGTGFTNLNFTVPDARSNYSTIPMMPGVYQLTGVNVIRVGDFNRDGKDDIAAWNQFANDSTGPNKVWVGLSTGSLFDWDLPTNVNEPGGGDMPWGRMTSFPYGNLATAYPVVGDFNGDATGKIQDDLLFYNANGSVVSPTGFYALMSNGVDGFNRPVGTTTTGSGPAALVSTALFSPLTSSANNVLVGDLNSDGRDDIWVAETNGTAFRLTSMTATPPVGSGLANGFTLTRSTEAYKWSLYPTTQRIFGILGRYWA